MKITPHIPVMATLSIGLLVLTACGGSAEGEPTNGADSDVGGAPELSEDDFVDGGTFRHAIFPEVGSIIPMSANQPQERQVITYAYETLLYGDPDGEYHPWLAESWEVGEDGTSVTFELKEGITFHDGTDFDAEAAAANINYHADPDNPSVVHDALPAGVEAEGDGLTLEVTTENPDPFFSIILGTIHMVSPTGLEDPTTLEEASNGTGLFELVGIEPDLYLYEKREDYTWGPDGLTSEASGLPDEVEVSIVADESTRANLLLSGEINAAGISGSERERVDEGDFDFVGTINPIGQMLFNEREDRPTHDPLVREALIRGFNHDDAAEVVSGGRPLELSSWITEAPFICYNEDPVWEKPGSDPERAAELLDEAGWTLDGETRSRDGEPLEINFIYDAGSESHASAAELLREDWLELGIETELIPMDGAAWSEYLYETFDYDTGWIQIGVGGPTTQHLFYGGASPEDGGLNFMGTDNEDYKELAAEAAVAADPEDACSLWDDAERIIVENYHTLLLTGTIQPTYMDGSVFEITDYIQPVTLRMTE